MILVTSRLNKCTKKREGSVRSWPILVTRFNFPGMPQSADYDAEARG